MKHGKDSARNLRMQLSEFCGTPATLGRAKFNFFLHCVRGRLCVPPSHWHRNIFSQPVAEAEVPADVASEFNFGKPWHISGLVR